MKYYFLSDLSNDGTIKLVYCQSEDQVANIQTKPLKLATFMKLCGLLEVCSRVAVKEDFAEGWFSFKLISADFSLREGVKELNVLFHIYQYLLEALVIGKFVESLSILLVDFVAKKVSSVWSYFIGVVVSARMKHSDVKPIYRPFSLSINIERAFIIATRLFCFS